MHWHDEAYETIAGNLHYVSSSSYNYHSGYDTDTMCKLGHSISHKHFPSPIICLFDKFGGQKLHQYLTQNKHIPNIQCCQSKHYRNSYLCRSISEFNKLTMYLRNISGTTPFLIRLRRYILQV